MKAKRDGRGMSQARLAELAHLTDGYISQIETGSRGKRFNRDIVIALAQALEAPPNELLEAAGLPTIDEAQTPARYTTVVNSDPFLRADQKRLLVELYTVFVGKTA
ncbi:MAG: helix-turn-helix domain-containing protein [Actinomycetota bacterium]|nr:helix-turn-helix domain-containing protein [Actinomycetota bacterium]